MRAPAGHPLHHDSHFLPAQFEAGAPTGPVDVADPFEAEAQFDPFEAMDAHDASPIPLEEPWESDSLAENSPEPPAWQEIPVQTPSDEESLYEETQEAVDRELMRRETQEGAASEMVDESPFVEELPSQDAAWDPSDIQDEPVDSLPEVPDYVDEDIEEPEPLQVSPEEQQRRLERGARERTESSQQCRELLDQVRADRIDDISLDIRVEGDPGEDFPFECGLGDQLFEGRSWSEITYMWKASGLCHKPLYFEQVQLERYGHSWGPYVQPIMSGAHFFASVPILPYKMGIQTPQECVYTLGHYRPGNCAPYMIEAFPFTWRAAIFQAGAATAIPFIVP
jgi:hypothetical protein